jgi:hypothetical protein
MGKQGCCRLLSSACINTYSQNLDQFVLPQRNKLIRTGKLVEL